MIYGYARVSTEEQNTGIQIEALNKYGVSEIFTDHGVSGKKASRPALDKLLSILKEGDILVVYKLSRLGRTVNQLSGIVDDFKARGIDLVSINEGFNITTTMGKAMCMMLAVFAEIERDNLVELVTDGVRRKKKEMESEGRNWGRPRETDWNTMSTRTKYRRMAERKSNV